ncbi:MAG TPA: FAD-dependent oxidoreductase [Coriobacteriia bacterium]
MVELSWDHEADIVVVGSGAAAYSAAITARSKGADVIMVEKAASHGGTTMRSGGGFWIPNNRFQRERGIVDSKDDATRYMARYSYPQLFDPDDPHLGLPDHEYELIESYYDHACEMVEFMDRVGAVKPIQEINWTGQPQIDYQEGIPENKCIRGRVLYSQDPEGKMSYGDELVRQMHSWATEHEIPLFLGHRVSRIVRSATGEVLGVEAATADGGTVSFRARKAVVFGSGGFTHDPDLMLRLQRGPHFGGCAAPANTGDFFYLGTEIGAMPANTAGAWRAEIVLEQALSDPNGSHNVFYVLGDSMLEVNKRGVRIMDEKRNYTDRSMVHFVWDPNRAEWTNMLVFYIYDERTATLWQGFPPLPPQGAVAPYVISADTLDGLAEAIGGRLKILAPHTGEFSLDPSFAVNLRHTVERYNAFAAAGLDEDFQRGEFAYDREWTTCPPVVPGAEWPPPGSKNITMYPLSPKGPYHAIILGAGTLDTNGGPMINGKAQVLDTHGKPIPGLYGAGNCIASPTANAYWGAGSTIGPALTFGHIAGLNAMDELVRAG